MEEIDKSFINNIDKDSPDTIIVNSIITMGHGLNMEFLAEGVETAGQFNFLKQNNCDIIQRYILNPSIPKEKIPDILKNEAYGKGMGIQLVKKLMSENIFNFQKGKYYEQ